MCDAIIYIHIGDSFYLDNIFCITRKYNPSKRIILIGNHDNEHYASKYNLEYFDINQINCLFDNYKHISVNIESYEKFCFHRWLYIDYIIQTNNLKNVICSDSDNLFFVDVDILYNYYNIKNYDIFCLGHDWIEPAVFFVNNIGINTIANCIKKYYDRSYEEIYNSIKSYINNNKHFSDMYLLKEIIDSHSNSNILTLTNCPDGFHIINNDQLCIIFCYTTYIDSSFNNLVYKNNTYYHNNIPIYSIHFQGGTKQYIESICKSIS